MRIFDIFKKKPSAPKEEAFRLTVSNRYTAYGGVYGEGKMEKGALRIGDKVYVYGKDGSLRFDGAKVIAINNEHGLRTDSVRCGDGTYAAIRLDQANNLGDFENGDIISGEKLDIKPATPTEQTEPQKKLPEPKTYNHPDRRTHINMATNDLCTMAASGSLESNRQWVRDVGQDLYDAHGFQAMQEVFINVKTRYPMAQTILSHIWDGIGGWAG